MQQQTTRKQQHEKSTQISPKRKKAKKLILLGELNSTITVLSAPTVDVPYFSFLSRTALMTIAPFTTRQHAHGSQHTHTNNTTPTQFNAIDRKDQVDTRCTHTCNWRLDFELTITTTEKK
jgi:hypothetical protein